MASIELVGIILLKNAADAAAEETVLILPLAAYFISS